MIVNRVGRPRSIRPSWWPSVPARPTAAPTAACRARQRLSPPLPARPLRRRRSNPSRDGAKGHQWRESLSCLCLVLVGGWGNCGLTRSKGRRRGCPGIRRERHGRQDEHFPGRRSRSHRGQSGRHPQRGARRALGWRQDHSRRGPAGRRRRPDQTGHRRGRHHGLRLRRRGDPAAALGGTGAGFAAARRRQGQPDRHPRVRRLRRRTAGRAAGRRLRAVRDRGERGRRRADQVAVAGVRARSACRAPW